MNEEVQKWIIKKPRRGGAFDDYSVQGLQYENTNGEIAWHISAWGDRNPVSHYWVACRKFYAVSIHFSCNVGTDDRVGISSEIENVPAAEKNAILKAIAEWEKPIEVETK
jgi:hypothetical protein